MNKRRVWCLYRVSTMGQVTKDEHNDRTDIPMQRSECHKFLQLHPDWEITNELSEFGISGFKTSLDQREKLVEIKQAAARKEFDVLLVYMFDRIGRRTYETPLIIKYLVDCGVEIWSVKEGQRKLETNIDELMCIIDSWVANNESRKTSVRISSGKALLAEMGHYSGGFVAYGHDAMHLGRINKKGHPVRDYVINPEEALVLESIFHAIVDEGLGSHLIAKKLNDKGIFSKTGNLWRASTVRSLLTNPVCLGYVKCKDAKYGPFEHLKIVDQYYFDKAAEILHGRAPKVKGSFHGPVHNKDNKKGLLKGLLFCGYCGGRLCIAAQTRRKWRVDGTFKDHTYLRYRCYKKLVSAAHEGIATYDAEYIETVILKVIRDFFSHVKKVPKHDMLLAASQREEGLAQIAFKQAEERLRKAEAALAKLKDEAIESITGNGPISIDVINSLIARQEKTVEEAKYTFEKAKGCIDAEQRAVSVQAKEVELLHTWANTFESASIEHKRMIIASIIDRITVKGDHEVDIQLKLDAQQYLGLAS